MGTNEKSNAEKIAQAFNEYCNQKNYQVTVTPQSTGDLRLDISNFKDRANVTVYHTAKFVVGGSPSSLKVELEDFKREFEKDPSKYLVSNIPDVKACATRYDILLPDLREKVKVNLQTLIDVTSTFLEKPKTNIEYNAKIQRNNCHTTLTQYSNGTLLLQGKNDALFSECCDLIDKFCNPSEKDVVSRFISGNEESVKVFAAKYTPEIITLAETEAKQQLGTAYDFLEAYDQKWFIASECISITEIPLPEYSPIVMPASKALEGFAKKLLISIGLFPADHFNVKKASFNYLYDNAHPSRKAICEKDKYADSYLKKLALCLDMSRNFMMHSDDAKVTKIESLLEAREKLANILKDAKEIFEYFDDIYHLI